MNEAQIAQKLARELAVGADKKEWSSVLRIDTALDWEFSSTYEPDLRAHFRATWGDQLPDLKLLEKYGYIQKTPGDPGEDSDLFILTDKAFALT